MLCSRVQNLLSAYCDREVVGEEMLRIREHLGRCVECREEYEALRRVKRLLGSLPAAEPARPFAMTMVEERGRKQRSWILSGWERDLDRLRRWIIRVSVGTPITLAPGHMAVAGAVGLTVLTVGILQQPQPPDAVTAHVPEEFVAPDLTPVSSGTVSYSSFHPSTPVPVIVYRFYPGRGYAPAYQNDLLPPGPGGLQTAEFVVPDQRSFGH